MLKYKIRNKQITIQHNFIKYSFSYMFRPYGVITRLTFTTYLKKCAYSVEEVRSHFLPIYLQFSLSVTRSIFVIKLGDN